LFGAAIFNHYQGLNWLTALLGSVSTVTTIGLYAPNINIMGSFSLQVGKPTLR
jgi:hypothetical protein